MKLIRGLLHLFCPVQCPICGRLGEALCAECLAALLKKNLPPRCLRCGGSSPCPEHPAAPFILSASPYRQGVERAILALKYGGCRAIGPRLGRGMAALWTPPDQLDLLIPVPLHRGSARGYNQALEIARGLGRAWGVPALDATRWAITLPPRAGLSREERLRLRADAFTVPQGLKGLRAALVDDVRTTGATLSRLASACADAGVEILGAYTAAGTEEEKTSQGR